MDSFKHEDMTERRAAFMACWREYLERKIRIKEATADEKYKKQQ